MSDKIAPKNIGRMGIFVKLRHDNNNFAQVMQTASTSDTSVKFYQNRKSHNMPFGPKPTVIQITILALYLSSDKRFLTQTTLCLRVEV